MKTSKEWADFWESADMITMDEVIQMAMAQAWNEGFDSYDETNAYTTENPYQKKTLKATGGSAPGGDGRKEGV